MKKSTNEIYKIILYTFILNLLILNLTGCSVIEQIAEYNLERLYEEKEEVVDTTIYLPESTYVKDAIELTMVNPKTLNPLDSLEYSTDQVLKLIYQSVLKLNADASIKAGLVSDYTKISEKVYRFTISDKAIFHNGVPVLSKDVKFSYETILDTEGSPYKYATEYIEAITEINEKVFEVKFNTLDYFNLYSMTFPVVSSEYIKSDDYKALIPIGSGPYQYENFQSMSRFDLVRNTSYMYDSPIADKVTVNIIRKQEDDYNMFIAKRIDIHSPSITLWESYSDDRKIKIYNYDSSFFYYFGINHTNNLLKDITGRQLVATTIPYSNIVKDGFLGHLSPTVLPIKTTHVLAENMDTYLSVKDSNSYFDELYSKDKLPEYISELRNNGNYMIDYSPITLRVIYNNEDYYSKEIIEVLNENQIFPQVIYQYIGLDSETYKLAIDTKDYDLFIGIIKTGLIPDLSSVYTTTGKLNVGGYNSINFNGLLSTYRKVSNEDQFINQLENLSKEATDELPIIPLGFLENGVFIHEFVGLGATPSNFNIYNNLEALEIIKN